MKKSRIVLAAVIALIFTVQINAQWATSGNNIYNTNSGNVGIGLSNPSYLLDVAKNMTAPTIAIRNLGGIGGAGFRIYDQISNSDWRLKSTSIGSFKLRDQLNSLDVIVVENNSAANSIFIKQGGFIGMGTTTPTNLLEVAKNITGPQIIIHNLGGGGGAGFTMIDDASSSATWKFKAIIGGGFKIRDHSNTLDVIVIQPNSAANSIFIKTGGNIGIGTNNPTSKLSVNGKIACKEVEVTLSGWSDFVFADNYNLRSLNEVEDYIKDNGHLPDVPSEKEILENGVNVGEMNSTLLRRIEELTLYMIELKKENELMKEQIETLMKK